MRFRAVAELLQGLFLGAAISGLTIVTPAQAHFLGYDSVDTFLDCEIHSKDSTALFDHEMNVAIDDWDDLKGSDDCVQILDDTSWTDAEIEWFDADREDVSWVGLYDNEPGDDDILLNNAFLEDMDDVSDHQTAAHELGHALGLAHSLDDQVMDDTVGGTDYRHPQNHDIADYESLWGPQ